MGKIIVTTWAFVWLVLAGGVNWVESKKNPSPPWGIGQRIASFQGLRAQDEQHNSQQDGKRNKTIGDDADHGWSSKLTTVDPSKMVSLMIRYGGLVLPDSTEKDIAVLRQVCSADCVKLNIVEKKLAIYNFTVHLPEDKVKYDQRRSEDRGNGNDENDRRCCLRIGRVYLHWDSYLRPCVDIEVDNVTVIVEFLNVMLTHHNWDELQRHGFPPTFPDPPEGEKEKSTFVRIGSIDMSGDICVCLTSRPLGKEIAAIKWDLDMLDSLNEDIQLQADVNGKEVGRKGCTTDQIYLLLRTYFARRTKQFFSETLEDISEGRMETLHAVSKVVSSTKDNVLKYAGDVGDWTEGQLNKKVMSRLQQWGAAFNDRITVEGETSNLATRLENYLNTTSSRMAASPRGPFKRVLDAFNTNKFFTQTP